MATSITPGDSSDYGSRRVTIEVIGGSHSNKMRKAKYIKTIPYSCLSQTIQGIHRLGGKITQITITPSHIQTAKIESVEQSIAEFLPQAQNISNDIYQVTQPTKAQQEQQAMFATTPAGNAVFNSEEYTFTEEW